MAAKPIIFYDIAGYNTAGSHVCFAPNPWKARLALNFKNAPYRTEWVELADVTSVRKTLAPPVRKWPDGSDFHTLPVINDTSEGGAIVGDSFDIALYLDAKYPPDPTANAPLLFPPATLGMQRAFNYQIDAIFTKHIMLAVHGMPLGGDAASMARNQGVFLQRAGLPDWESFAHRGEERAKTLEGLRTALEDIAEAYARDASGPFLAGKDACYADLILGAWLLMLKATVPGEEWALLETWHGGCWGRLMLALEPYAVVR